MAEDARCPYCLDALVGTDPVVRCVFCRTPHHRECFDENGGCVAFACGSVVAGAAGRSVLLRGTLDLGEAWSETALDPLEGALVRSRAARPLASERANGESLAAVKLVVERAALYPGQSLRARVVVSIEQPTIARRLWFEVRAEPGAPGEPPPRRARAVILGRPPLELRKLLRSVGSLGRGAPRLAPGVHPFEVEVPSFYDAAVPYGASARVSAVLERKGEPALASGEVEVRAARPGAPGEEQPGEAIVARGRERAPERAPSIEVPPLPPQPGFDSEFADAPTFVGRPGPSAGAWPRVERSAAAPPPDPPARERRDGDALILPPGSLHSAPPREVAPAPAAPRAPAAPGGPRIVVRPRAAPAEPGAAPPAPPLPIALESPDPEPLAPRHPEPVADEPGWTTLAFLANALSGTATGRVARARFEPRRELPPLRLSLEASLHGDATPTIELVVDSPRPLRTLELACRYELAAEGRPDVALGGFPRTEEASLVGPGALERERTGRDDAIRVRIPVDPALLAEARAAVAGSALVAPDLVVRLAADGVLREGTIAGSGTRVVRVPLPLPDASRSPT